MMMLFCVYDSITLFLFFYYYCLICIFDSLCFHGTSGHCFCFLQCLLVLKENTVLKEKKENFAVLKEKNNKKNIYFAQMYL